MNECFSIGDRVKVITDNYKGRTVGLIGTVRSVYDGSIAVVLDNLPNTRSKYNCYYFRAKQLEFLKGEMNIMEGIFRVALVNFLEGSNRTTDYAYACYDDDIMEGDICVGKTAHHGFALVKVRKFVTDMKTDSVTREIVCKADFTAYDERVQRRERSAQLMADMKKRAAAAQELLIYKTLAAQDPVMAELLNEYEKLKGGNTNEC